MLELLNIAVIRVAATRRLTAKVEAWPCRVAFNIFLGGDSLTQIESSLGGLTRLVSIGGQPWGQEPGDVDDIS